MSYFDPKTYKADKEATKSLYIGFFFVSLFSVALIVLGIYFISNLFKVSNYNETYGNVINSQIISYRGSKGQTFYKPLVNYNYYVDGEKHTGNTYDYFSFQKGRALSSEIIRENPPNKEIKVYVNPENRFESVLDKTIHPYYFTLLPAISAIFFFWLATYEMYKTGNYYMLYTKGRNRLTFAYPTAKGFAATITAFATLIYGFISAMYSASITWSFFVLWVMVLTFIYIVSFIYKSNHLEFSELTNNAIIESEGYKNGGKSISVLKDSYKVPTKTKWILSVMFVFIIIFIVLRLSSL